MIDSYYMKDVLSKFRHYRTNKAFDDLVSSLKIIDSISNYDEFKESIRICLKYDNGNKLLSRQEFGEEGLLYGHRNAFFEYAGVNTKNQRFILPAFEHGADLRGNVNGQIYNKLNHSFVFQSDYKNEIVHKERPMAPTYNVGPYIMYARNLYDSETLNNIKEEFGKTALLFPAHTFEGASVEFDKERFVSRVIEEFSKDYNTILVCVYWKDVEDPLYDVFKKEGARLVSAGFRGDPNFITRLRTLIELSDVVASNLTGSYIGYSMALDKPFYMFKEQAVLNSSMHILNKEEEYNYNQVIDSIKYTFSSIHPTEEQLKLQHDLFRRYWGGKELFKTEEEAKSIISLSLFLLKKSKGFTNGFESAVRNIIDGKTMIDEKLYVLLQESIRIQ